MSTVSPSHVNYEVNRILCSSKGYWEVNYDTSNGNRCLKMYKNECRNHFTPEMEKLGYKTVMENIPDKHAMIRCFIYKNGELVDPRYMLPVFEKLNAIPRGVFV